MTKATSETTDVQAGPPPHITVKTMAHRLGMNPANIVSMAQRIVMADPSHAVHFTVENTMKAKITRRGLELMLPRFVAKPRERAEWGPIWFAEFDRLSKVSVTKPLADTTKAVQASLPLDVPSKPRIRQHPKLGWCVDVRSLVPYGSTSTIHLWMQRRIERYELVDGVDYVVKTVPLHNGLMRRDIFVTPEVAGKIAGRLPKDPITTRPAVASRSKETLSPGPIAPVVTLRKNLAARLADAVFSAFGLPKIPHAETA